MARRTVVVEPPPGAGRRTVHVVRAGPPVHDKRRAADIAVGVLGVLLLAVMVFLFTALPQDPPVLPNYEVSYPPTQAENLDVQDAVLTEGAEASFTLPFSGDFLYRVEVVVEWTDDVPESHGDTFEFTLTSPEGDVVVGPEVGIGPEPRAQGGAAPTYVAQTATRAIVHELAERPTPHIIAGETPDWSLEEAEAEARTAAKTAGTGDWVLTARLVDAGDCPAPDSIDPARILACNAATNGAGDNGNALQVVRVIFTSYEPSVVRV